MSQWLEQVIDNAQNVSDFLSPARDAALSELKLQGWPGRRTESWRFTPLSSVEKRVVVENKDVTTASAPVIENLEVIDIVFSNGQLITDTASLALPKGVSICQFKDADADQQAAISSLYGKVKPQKHTFGLVNDALAENGVFIDVAAGASIEPVMRISNLSSQPCDAHTRLIVRLGDGARATVMEFGEGSCESLTTAFAEYSIGYKAHLEHYRFAMFTGKAKQVGGSHFKLSELASLNSTLVGYGSELSRLDVDIWHAGEFANAKMNAIYLLAENELFDLHSCIEHAVPNGTTEENARGIIGDGAKAVFNGRIHIHRDAQKTLAELNNRNLLLSRRGIINTKPELEIYADDVKCAHGATVAEIDDTALYYLLTRGISRSRALVMLNFGFVQELVAQIPKTAIADWLLPKLSKRFAEMEVK
ncbi:SufD family Fe-S cluster assembly protein [Aestuariibacter sp. A3R04]|uniref:SufB/SufD family protein n=1 Tax=Aestuariibacter sp. A3R04 TaxID=2841571 RepID=UPI001C07FC8C|nr:SufD family Fe-S cluster assembly protein [Aestuariibacter sp. A3R04]MBU3021797.1 SufD family Fe-S cluster assembly protein [Aestuariibacter sp. A3R04]